MGPTAPSEAESEDAEEPEEEGTVCDDMDVGDPCDSLGEWDWCWVGLPTHAMSLVSLLVCFESHALPAILQPASSYVLAVSALA